MAVDMDMDIECLELCAAMNMMPGIETVASCCGHGEHPYHIWFKATGLRVIPRLLYYFDGCHCGYYGWRVIACTDCAMSPVTFMVEGPSDLAVAREQSKQIASLLQGDTRRRRG